MEVCFLVLFATVKTMKVKFCFVLSSVYTCNRITKLPPAHNGKTIMEFLHCLSLSLI
jgi:hypothetical protein